MISYETFKNLLSFDTKGRYCTEILFAVKGSEKFHYCWMGKMPNKSTGADVYWYGLTDDGKNAYDYQAFDEMVSDKVFDGKSLSEIWDDIVFLEVDGCEPYERFSSYINKNGPFMSAASNAVFRSFFCDYLNQSIDEGMCQDIQMISNGYILPDALPDVKINNDDALKTCEKCQHKMCKD